MPDGERLAEAVREAATSGKVIYLTDHGQRLATIVPAGLAALLEHGVAGVFSAPAPRHPRRAPLPRRHGLQCVRRRTGPSHRLAAHRRLVERYRDLPLGAVDASVIACAERLGSTRSPPSTGGISPSSRRTGSVAGRKMLRTAPGKVPGIVVTRRVNPARASWTWSGSAGTASADQDRHSASVATGTAPPSSSRRSARRPPAGRWRRPAAPAQQQYGRRDGRVQATVTLRAMMIVRGIVRRGWRKPC